MGELKLFRGVDRCHQCGLEAAFQIEVAGRRLGVCRAHGDGQYGDALLFGHGISHFYIPAGNGKYRRLSDATEAEIDQCENWQREKAKYFKEAYQGLP